MGIKGKKEGRRECAPFFSLWVRLWFVIKETGPRSVVVVERKK